MKLKFDPNQSFQLEAINAICDIFEGQPLSKSNFELKIEDPMYHSKIVNELIIGNQLLLGQDTISKNLKRIQKQYGITETKLKNGNLLLENGGALLTEDRNKISLAKEKILQYGMNFSVEMETGTGKTYVYLRTIHELHKKYGFKKFVIVVPSIAIKEGVLKNLQITREHFDLLYENPEMDYYVYDPRKRGQVKSFATGSALQILVINIDSFAKFSDSKAGKNIIYQNSDWGIPIEYIKGVKPIVIVDEPQNMETDIRRRAIENLDPLCTLRYSATHKYHYNLVYKLDPVQAYDQGLVKKIEVDSVLSADNYNTAYIELKAVRAKKMTVTANIRIDINTKNGVKKKDLTVKVGNDLYKLSNQREIYQNGYIINEIDVSYESVTFSSGNIMYVGQSQGGLTDEIMKYQIKRTIQTHLEKELALKDRGIKVLSLFFIDRVANYRDYQDEKLIKGKFAHWFEEIFEEAIKNSKFQNLVSHEIEKIHNGYFSQDKKGHLKDTKGDSKADDDTYALIMKDKEKLLSLDVPLRFIFSHSALREGWDNPNVFQICTLNETQSEMKKRQEIGRGLRLPVNQEGERIQDENINILTVTANESYHDFAKTLQTEIEDECGVSFEGRIKNKEERKKVQLKKGFKLDENFKVLWDKIKQKTRYKVVYQSEELIKEAGKDLSDIEITAPKIINIKVGIKFNKEGIQTDLKGVGEKNVIATFSNIPDILGQIQEKTRLTKDTILRIIKESGKISEIMKNPQQFIDFASETINRILKKMMVDGIKYEKIAGEFWEMTRFENDELEGYMEQMFKVNNQDKTLYDYIQIDSDVENRFAKDLESREDVKFYIKLPHWFTILTPLGTYNPDWAIVFETDKKIYFVAETKGTNKLHELREAEQLKIECGVKHFDEFDDVNFKAPVQTVSEIMIK